LCCASLFLLWSRLSLVVLSSSFSFIVVKQARLDAIEVQKLNPSATPSTAITTLLSNHRTRVKTTSALRDTSSERSNVMDVEKSMQLLLANLSVEEQEPLLVATLRQLEQEQDE
jgi:hypothetical protein